MYIIPILTFALGYNIPRFYELRVKSEYFKISSADEDEEDDYGDIEYIHDDDLQGVGREDLILVFTFDMECICNIDILPD